MNEISLVEPISGGHHGTYLRWLAESILDCGCRPGLVTTRCAAGSVDFQQQLGGTELLARTKVVEVGLPFFGEATRNLAPRLFWAYWLSRATYRARGSSSLFLPYADLFLYQLAVWPSILNGWKWSGIAMSPTFHHPSVLGNRKRTALDKVKEMFFGKLLSQPNLSSLFCIDPLLPEYCVATYGERGHKVHYFADPVDATSVLPRDRARDALNLSPYSFIVLCYGSIALRKGLREIAGCLESESLNENIVFVVAGQPDAEAEKLLSSEAVASHSKSGRIKLNLHYCSPDLEAKLFAAADLIWVVYTDFHQMSGIVARALAYGIPFVGAPGGLIGWYAKTLQAGVLPSTTAIPDIVSTLNYLVDHPSKMERLRRNSVLNGAEFSVMSAKNAIQHVIKKR